MSSFFQEYGTEIFAVLCLVLCVATILWLCLFRHWHVGFGERLFLRMSDGTVWIGSRLIKSPAGKHGIGNQQRVLSINGHRMTFRSFREYEAWFRKNKPKLGERQTWIVQGKDGIITVTMEPVLITTRIPWYGNPNVREVGDGLLHDTRIKRGLYFCTKTGQYITTESISSHAILETYFQ